MNVIDIAQFCGFLVSAWAVGFTAGFILTKYRDAVSQIV